MARTSRTICAKRSGLRDCPPSDRASYDEAICAGGNGRARDGRDVLPMPGAVTGVQNDREMGGPLEHRDGVDVRGVPGAGLEGADAPFAHHHLPVAFAQDVFGSQQPLGDRGTHPTFEEDGFAHATRGFK